MNFLKRAYVWCQRFRHRKGYGVHSPFAFELLTDVVYERRPYYAYAALDGLRRSLPSGVPRYSRRVDRLLFRLVNRFRPRYILEVGTGGGLSLRHLAAARCDAECVSLCGETPLPVAADLADGCKNAALAVGDEMDVLAEELRLHPAIGLLHVAHTPRYKEVYEACVSHADGETLFVIEGIHESRAKREWWEQVVADGRTVVTFDLYEVGLVFFDRQKNKQHYVVSF